MTARSTLLAMTLALVACGGAPSPAPVAAAAAAPADAAPSIECSPVGSHDDDPPAVALFEREAWPWSADFPTVALWPDGRIVFFPEYSGDREPRQARISAADARKLIDEIALSTRGAPAKSAARYDTGLGTVDIVILDDSAWRVASVYGIWREDLVDADPHERVKQLPPAILAAYRMLLAVRPETGDAFEPDEIEIQYVGFAEASNSIPWPSDVPAPPAYEPPVLDPAAAAAAEGAEVDMSEPGGTRLVCGRYLEAVQRLSSQALSSDPPQAIEHDGHKWAIIPKLRYRGERVIDDVLAQSRPNRRTTP